MIKLFFRLNSEIKDDFYDNVQHSAHSAMHNSFPNTNDVPCFKEWKKKITTACNGNFYDYSGIILHLKNVLIDQQYSNVVAKANQNISQTIHQKEEDEIYQLNNGFYQLVCDENPQFHFLNPSPPHLKSWLSAIAFRNNSISTTKAYKTVSQFTIATMRYEYSNVYWTIMDIYNIYLTALFLNKTVANTSVIIIDQHPMNKLDELYKTTFNTSFLSENYDVILYKELAWNFGRIYSPFLNKNQLIPLLPDFRNHIIKAFQIKHSHIKNCSTLNIVLILRNNYISHPRNPTGFISRKIKNEIEVISALREEFPQSNIIGQQLDLLSVKEQINILSSTDILMGMHGAAFGYAVLLQPGGAVLEMFPQYYTSHNWHMEHLAKSNGLHYYTWKNKNKANEDSKKGFTIIDTVILRNLLRKIILRLCTNK